MQIGRLQNVGIAKEDTKGTGVSPTYWLSVDDWDLNPVIDKKNKEGAFNRIEDSYDSDIVKKHNEPSFSGLITDKSIGLLLYSALGSLSSDAKDAPNSDVYDHTISVQNDNNHPALTVSMKDAYVEKWVSYAMLNRLELDFSLEEYAKFTAEFIGKYEADNSFGSPSYTNENAFVPRHITVKVADSVSGLASANSIDLQSINLVIDKNVEPIFKFGSNEPNSIHNRQLALSGSLERVEDSETWRDYFDADTEKAVRIELTNDDVTIGDSENPKLVIDLANVKFNPYSRDNDPNEFAKENIDFKGFYDSSEGKSIEATLTNTETSY